MSLLGVFARPGLGEISFVLARLWERGEKELHAFGLDLPAALKHFVLAAEKGEAWWLQGINGPVAVFGLSPQPDGTLSTWFQATDEFLLHHRAITKILRGILRRRATGRPIFLISPLVHPKAANWFALLGFVLEFVDRWAATGHPMGVFKLEVK